MNKTNKVSSTQQYLPIWSIEQDIIVMKNGSLKGVLHASPINFELKSETEQNSIIYGYQSFINSLQYPIQIVIRSKRLDLERYLVKLESQTKNITNNLLTIQAQDYIGFVRRLIQIANIMSKHFYVVVGFEHLTPNKNPLTSFLPNKNPVRISESQFQTDRQELINRLNIVAAGLNQIGIRTEALNTQSIIELFYNIYNPEESMTERLAPIGELEAEVVSKENLK